MEKLTEKRQNEIYEDVWAIFKKWRTNDPSVFMHDEDILGDCHAAIAQLPYSPLEFIEAGATLLFILQCERGFLPHRKEKYYGN